MKKTEKLTVFRGCTPVVDDEYGGGDNRTPTQVVVDAIATAAGVDPTDLPPLYEFVDTNAVDNLFERHDGATAANTLLSFQVDTWNVFVHADGRIRVCDATQPTEPEPVFETSVV